MLPLNSNDFNLTSSSPFYRTARRSNDGMSPWGSAIKIRDSSPVGINKGISFSARRNHKISSTKTINQPEINSQSIPTNN